MHPLVLLLGILVSSGLLLTSFVMFIKELIF